MRYWVSEYVITKNDNAVRGIYISREKFNPDNPEDFLVVYSYRSDSEKIGFPKRPQRKNLLKKLLSTGNIVSSTIVGIRSRLIKKESYNVLRCNVGKTDFEELQKLRAKLKDSEAIKRFDRFFKDYERS